MNKKIVGLVWCIGLFIIIPQISNATTPIEIDKICPLDGTKFTGLGYIAHTILGGQQLDLKPHSTAEQPLPIPVCPSCHFVVYKTVQLVAGELERRLGYFDDAQKRFLSLKELPEFKEGLLAQIITYQLELISQFDNNAHEIPKDE